MLCLLLLHSLAVGAAAREDSRTDAVLLLDTSASMLTADPDNHRLDAIRGFMALLGDEDRLAVLTFAETVNSVSDFVVMNQAERQRLETLVQQQMTPSGAYTNLLAPIQRALEQLRGRRADARTMVILLTDGRMDMGDDRLNERQTVELLNAVVPQYRSRGIPIYALAFTEESDLGLLDNLATATGGRAQFARDAVDVWHVFGDFFEIIKMRDRLPVSNGVFQVDGSVREFSVLADKQSALPLSIRSPSGKETVSKSADGRNHILKIENPETGKWSINNAVGKETVLAESAVQLCTDLPDSISESRQPISVKVWTESKGSGANDNERLIRVALRISPAKYAESASLQVPLREIEGQQKFSGFLPVLKSGSYEVAVDASGESYFRSKHRSLNVFASEKASSMKPAVPAKLAGTPVLKSALPRPATTTPKPMEKSDLLRFEDAESLRIVRLLVLGNVAVVALVVAGVLWRRQRKKLRPPGKPPP